MLLFFSGWAQVIISYCREEGKAENKPCESTVRGGSAGEWTHTGQWGMATARCREQCMLGRNGSHLGIDTRLA